MFIIKTFHKALVNFFVTMNTDFNIIRLKKFKNLLLICQLNLNISKQTVLIELIESYTREIESLIYCNLSKNWKISLVIDVWSSSNQLLFLNVIAYFVNNNWKFQEITIVFKIINNKHSDQILKEYLYKIVKKYNLQKRLLRVTVNNAFNNEIMYRLLFCHFWKDDVKWNTKMCQISCLTYIMQLLVIVFLQRLKINATNEIVLKQLSEKRLSKISVTDISIANTFKKINTFFY